MDHISSGLQRGCCDTLIVWLAALNYYVEASLHILFNKLFQSLQSTFSMIFVILLKQNHDKYQRMEKSHTVWTDLITVHEILCPDKCNVYVCVGFGGSVGGCVAVVQSNTPFHKVTVLLFNMQPLSVMLCRVLWKQWNNHWFYEHVIAHVEVTVKWL